MESIGSAAASATGAVAAAAYAVAAAASAAAPVSAVHAQYHDAASRLLSPLGTSALHGDGVWVFGFGSLVYKPGFEYAAAVDGYIAGWRRVWHQGSTDHRGTPERPGRTATLVQEDGAVTWGRAYLLAGDQVQQLEALKYLEWREKQYDVRHYVDVHVRGSGLPVVRDALVYIASQDRARNQNYLGPASLELLVQQVAVACGPSGPNWEYVVRLADAMREMGADDAELFALEAAVLQARMAAAAEAGQAPA